MAFQFPVGPLVGQIFTPATGISYQWNGTGWVGLNTAGLTAAQASTLYIPLTQRAAASGVATLDAGAKVPVAQLPTGTSGLATLNASGKVPEAQLIPSYSGQVLQMVALSDVGTFTASTAYSGLTLVATGIQPKSASSTLLVEASFFAQIDPLAGLNVQGNYRMFDFNLAIADGDTNVGLTNGPGSFGVYGAAALRGIFSNTALTFRQFVIQGKTSNAAAAIAAYAQRWSITEIQA